MILTLRITIKSSPERLPFAKLKHKWALFRTSTNTGAIYLSGSYLGCDDSKLRFSIPKDTSETIKLTNLEDLWVFGTLNDAVDILAEVVKTPTLKTGIGHELQILTEEPEAFPRP